jgi:hypothetical protein
LFKVETEAPGLFASSPPSFDLLMDFSSPQLRVFKVTVASGVLTSGELAPELKFYSLEKFPIQMNL